MQDALKRTREKMKTQFAALQVWFIIYSLLAVILITITLAMLVFFHPASPLLIENTDDKTAESIAKLSLGLGAIVALFAALPWTSATWWRHYYFVWRHLKFTDLARLVADEAHWQQAIERGQRSFWQRATDLRMPKSLVEQIELVADYWQYALVRSRNEHSREARALAAGNWTRLANDIGGTIFNLGCGIGCLVAGSLLLVALLPLVLVIMHFHLKQQATKAALIDYFLDKPELNRSKLKPPPGM